MNRRMELVGSESGVSLLLSLEDAVYLIFIYETSLSNQISDFIGTQCNNCCVGLTISIEKNMDYLRFLKHCDQLMISH